MRSATQMSAEVRLHDESSRENIRQVMVDEDMGQQRTTHGRQGRVRHSQRARADDLWS